MEDEEITLVLPLLHDPSSRWAYSHKVGQTRYEHRQQRRQYMQPVLVFKNAGQT